MDATTSGNPTLPYHNIPDQAIAAIVASPFQRQQRHCFGDSTPGEFPLSANPSIVLHVLTACNLDPQDLAKLEASSMLYPRFTCEAVLELFQSMPINAAFVFMC